MTSIANLSVSLTAQTQGFTEAMQGIHKHVEGLHHRIEGLSHRFMHFAEALAIGAIGGEIGEVLKKTAEMAVHTAVLADRLGYTIDELQAYRDAATLAGVSTDAMDSSLKKFSQTIGEGSGKTDKTLKAIGLSLDQVSKMRPAEQFKAVADGIAHLSTQEEKAAAATRLFGRGHAEIMAVLQKGRQRLDESAEATRRLRGEFSRVDAGKVEQAHEALAKLHMIISGVLMKSVSLIAPYITAVAERFLKMGEGGKSAADTIVDAMVKAAKSFALIFDGIGLIESAWYALIGVVDAFAEAMAKASGYIGEFFQEIANLFGAEITDTSAFDDNAQHVLDLEKKKQEAFGKSLDAYNAAMNHEYSGAVVREASAIQRAAELKAAADDVDRKHWASPAYHLKDNGVSNKTTAIGTFSGEAASRLVGGVMTVDEEQLEELKDIKDVLGNINDNLAGGVPAD